MKKTPPAVLSLLRQLVRLAAIALSFIGFLHAEAPPTILHIAPAGTDTEGLRAFRLDWNAAPNAMYGIQASADLSSWKTVDAIFQPDVIGSYQFSVRATDASGFYRLGLPKPQITAVEPAVVDVSVPNAQLYILGQCLPNNGLVLINGLIFTPTIINSGGVWAVVSLNGLPPGQPWFDVTIVDPGTSVVVATLPAALLGVDASSPYLLEPPDAPPASPTALWLSKKGYDYWQAQSDLAAAKAGEKSPRDLTKSALKIALNVSGGGGGIRENDNVTFDVEDGKKGLNAVNVKRARMAGGDGDPKIFPGAPDKCGDGIVQGCSGEVRQQVVDLAVEGRGLDFVWARAYNSRIGRSSAPNGWTFSYDVRCALTASSGMDVYDGTGRKDTYKLQADGTYTCPEFLREGTLTSGVFRLTFADSGFWEFNPLVGAPSDGKLARIQDRNGNAILLNYDSSGRLVEIVDDLGRTNTVGYDLVGRVASITDFSGRTVTYQYYQGLPGEPGSAGDLAFVTSPPVIGTPNGNDFPTGKTTSYTYSTGYLDDRENHLLLSVIDASGQTISTYVYQHNQSDFEFLRCTSIQHWTNTPTMISYLPQAPTPANQFATMRCIVNGPVGDVTECFFDARNRPVKMQEFTGRATPGVRVSNAANRPAFKVRPGDPDSYETRWSWNHDSLCTREVGPGGQQVQCVYESDFDPATRARKRADCRVVREIASSPVDLDGDGAADVTERVWRYEYDPRFGSDPSMERLHSPGQAHWGNARLRSGVIAEVGAGRPATVGRESIQLPQNCDPKAKSLEGLTSKTAAVSAIGSIPIVGGLLRGASDLSAPGARGIILARPGGGWIGSGAANGTASGTITVVMSALTGGGQFVTSATDPRGNVATASYDASGNVAALRRNNRPVFAAFDFAYNSSGQLTAITNAPDANGYRSVDTFTYAQGQVAQCVEDAGGLNITTSFEYDTRGNLTRVIDPRGNDWLYNYNSLDQFVQTESAALGGGGPGGYRIKTQFSYDANDKLTLVAEENRDAAGTLGTNPFWRTQFVYDGGQRLTGCWRDKNGALVLRCTSVEYNAADQVVLYRSPEAVNGNDPSNTVAFAYDERGLPYRTIAAPGSPVQSTTQCDYDPNGNVTRVSEGLEGTPSITTMEYDGFAGFDSASLQIQGKGRMGGRMFSNRSSPTAPAIQGAIYTMFLPSGKPCRATVSLVQERHARFDEAVRTENVRARLRSGVSHGSKGNTSIGAAYLGINRLSKITDPMGNVTTFHYDANDNRKVARHLGELNDVLGSTDNIRLAESRYEYDGQDRPIRSRDSFFSLPSQAPIGDGERTTTFAYAPNSECTSITDDLGRVTTFAYDTACRLSTITSSGGKTVLACFKDAAGNVTQTTQTDQPDLGGLPQVFVWTNVHDALNRPVSTSDNVGNTNQFAYDSRGNCTSTTNPNGNETVYGYDGLSRTVSSTTYQGGTTTIVSSGQFAYDDNDRITSSTDANGNVTMHAYDSLDRLTQTTQADGTHHTQVWSPRSNLIEETDANGTVIDHSYDLNDRCTANTITPGAGVATTTTFETFAYDGASRLVSADNDVSHIEIEYDSLGNCTRGVSGGVGAVVTPHDSVGNRLSMTYPSGRVLSYAYDALDQRTSINENGAPLASFSYAGPGRVARVIYGNGTSNQVTYDGLSGIPNALDDFGQGMISSVTHAVPGTTGPQSFAAVNLKWDRNGNKTLRSDTIFAPAIPRTNDLGLQYDAANRLTRATVTRDLMVLRDTVYGFDLMGNRTNVTGAASCSGSYTMDGLVPGPLDSKMNQYTATPCDTRSYNENGDLINRTIGALSSVNYTYDYAGRLVKVNDSGILVAEYAYDALGRRISKTVYSGSLPPVTTQFIYDGGCVVEERVNGAVAASFVLDGTQSQDDGIIQMNRSGQNYYFHTDDQGNVLALTDDSGAVVERYDYDDYGKVTFLTSDGVATTATSSAVGNVYCWGGMRLDPETGLHNNDGGDFLEPQTGRAVRGKVKDIKDSGMGYSAVRGKVKNIKDMGSGRAAGNNPWSDGPPSPLGWYKGGKTGHVTLLR